MPTLEERVGHLEQGLAQLQGKLIADMTHIETRFDRIDDDISKLFNVINEIHQTITVIKVSNATVNQKSSTNEKIIFAIAGVIVSAVTFLVGKLL